MEKGNITLHLSPEDWLKQAFQNAAGREAPVTIEIARLNRDVSLLHQDPADRFLAATAIHLDLTLITADTRLMNWRDFSVLPNR